jgi:pimeloyl-ACP methyl ester carboxylesterase
MTTLRLIIILATVATLCGTTLPGLCATAGAHQSLSINTSDGVTLIGDLWTPAGSTRRPLVVLLHMMGRTRAGYKSLPAQLLASGFAVAAYDLRGHGDSCKTKSGTEINRKDFGSGDWAKISTDTSEVITALKSYPGVDAQSTALVGASIGANAAAIAARNDPRIKALVLLSPGQDYMGLNLVQVIPNLKRPVYIIASKEDKGSAESSTLLSSKAPRTTPLLLLNGAGHGTIMLDTRPDLNKHIADWLAGIMLRKTR